MEDISALKVADLRRELKDRGLPITGTKIELVSRLQEALTSEKPTSDDSALDDALLDEDSMLAGEDEDESGAEVETSDTENLSSLDLTSPITTSPPKAAAAKLTGALPTGATAKVATPVDSKRNGATQGTEDGSSAAKKIKISREPVQAPVAKQVTVTSPAKPVAAAVSPTDESGDGSEAQKINIKAALAAADRSKLRQIKFGSDTAAAAPAAAAAAPAAGGLDKRQQRAARFGIAATETATAAPASGTVKGSTTLSPEEQARLEKRKERFGKELADVQESVEKAKEKRAQRFGGGGSSAAAGGKADEKKQSRAARFGV